jgi:hypothetical protein
MDTTEISSLVGLISTIFTLLGVTGINAADINGFLTVVGGLITAVSLIVAWISHKSAITAANNALAAAKGARG